MMKKRKVKRRNKDKTVGNGGKRFIQIMKEGFYIMNDRTRGDWKGEYTYIGARDSTL